MITPPQDFRSLLGGELWLAAGGAVLAGLYGVVGDVPIGLALGAEYLLIASAIWAVRDLRRKTDRTIVTADSMPAEPAPDGAIGQQHVDLLHAAVQTERIVLGSVGALAGLIALVQLLQLTLGGATAESGGTAASAICLAAAFVWHVLARSFQAIDATDLPAARSLKFACIEAQWGALVAAAGLLGAALHPPVGIWAARILCVWVLAISAETIVRGLAVMFVGREAESPPLAPIHLSLREAAFTAANPVASLIRTLEEWCGVSVRSSWALAFVRRSLLPLAALLVALCWGLSSLAIVQTHQMAVREHFGRVVGEPLSPGLHVTLPWPFGRIRSFPVKTVQQMPVGYVEGDMAAEPHTPRALLWTKPHAKEELALVLGDGTEMVAVNAIVYYKISEDPAGFLDFVYRQSAPEEALTAFTYKALMQETRGRTLDDVLSADRADFTRRLVDSVRRQARGARLGLEVVDLALLNLHPPIEVAGDYLEVINARLDARRRVTEADGQREVALLGAQTHGGMAIAAAQTEGSRRVGSASGDVAEFKAVAQAQGISPQTLRLRLWIEALESAFTNQRLFLVDRRLLEAGGELMLDTRQQSGTRLPAFDESVR